MSISDDRADADVPLSVVAGTIVVVGTLMYGLWTLANARYYPHGKPLITLEMTRDKDGTAWCRVDHKDWFRAENGNCREDLR